MSCYGNKEIKYLGRVYWVMAASLTAGTAALVLFVRHVCQRRIMEAVEQAFSAQEQSVLRSLLQEPDPAQVWIPVCAAGAVFLLFFLYMTRSLSGIYETVGKLSLGLEQMIAGRRTNLSEWKEGIVSSLSNQAELLCRRNAHLIDLMQEEKERLFRFVENMVHQMKTPLTALQLDLDLMDMQLEPLREAGGNGLDRKLQDCMAQCGKLKAHVEEFMTDSQVSSGTLHFLSSPADVEGMLESVGNGLSVLLEARQIRLSIRSESKIPLYCDSGWMKAAFSNLIKNSIESMKQGGTIAVRHWDEGCWKYVVITDEGGGISEETAAHMFERFYTGKEREGGTGIGLHAAKEIIESCHGSIEAQPYGKGTRFQIRFRILDGPETYAR